VASGGKVYAGFDVVRERKIPCAPSPLALASPPPQSSPGRPRPDRAPAAPAPLPPRAQAVVVAALKTADGADAGTVTGYEGPMGMIFRVEGKGWPAGWHAVHLHAVGSCEAPGFTSAGGHVNHAEGARPHGLLNKTGGPDLGDLQNVFAAADGAANADVYLAWAGSGRPRERLCRRQRPVVRRPRQPRRLCQPADRRRRRPHRLRRVRTGGRHRPLRRGYQALAAPARKPRSARATTATPAMAMAEPVRIWGVSTSPIRPQPIRIDTTGVASR
jgi:hypothetical protein